MDREAGHLPFAVKDKVSSLIWIKVVAAGNAGVGKTCIIKHFCEDKFSHGYQPTVGVDYGFKIQSISNVDLRVHLWDLSGHPDYQEVRNELFSDTQIDIKAKRVVQSDEAMRWAAGKKVKYYETSAFNGDGISKMFTEILEEVMAKSSQGTR